MSTLITDIQSYCDRVGIKPSTFGYLAVNDGKFFARISAGGRFWPETEATVRAYMDANPAPPPPLASPEQDVA